MIHSSISIVIDISDSTANIIFKLFYFHTVESCIDGWFSFYFLDTLYTRKWVFILLFIVIVIHFHTVMVNDTKQAIILVLFTSFLSLSYVVCWASLHYLSCNSKKIKNKYFGWHARRPTQNCLLIVYLRCHALWCSTNPWVYCFRNKSTYTAIM